MKRQESLAKQHPVRDLGQHKKRLGKPPSWPAGLEYFYAWFPWRREHKQPISRSSRAIRRARSPKPPRLGYMRTVLRAQKIYQKKNDKFATSLADLVHTGSFTQRMVNPDRGDYSVGFKPKQRRLRSDHDTQAARRRPSVVLRRRGWHIHGDDQGPANENSPVVK